MSSLPCTCACLQHMCMSTAHMYVYCTYACSQHKYMPTVQKHVYSKHAYSTHICPQHIETPISMELCMQQMANHSYMIYHKTLLNNFTYLFHNWKKKHTQYVSFQSLTCLIDCTRLCIWVDIIYIAPNKALYCSVVICNNLKVPSWVLNYAEHWCVVQAELSSITSVVHNIDDCVTWSAWLMTTAWLNIAWMPRDH